MSYLSEAFDMGNTCAPPAHAATTCPPRMSDGRAFTDYRQTCALTSEVNQTSGAPMSSNQMRAFFTQNAERIMDKNRAAAQRVMGCSDCYSLDCSGTMLPELSTQISGTRTVSFPVTEPMGLGLGRATQEGFPLSM